MTTLASASGATAAAPPSDSALRGRDIVCFSHDWSGDPLSKNHLMRLLARENRVLWVNSIGYRTPTVSKADLGRAAAKLRAAARPIREVVPNLFVMNPLAIPVYGRPAIRALNRAWLRSQVRAAMRRLEFRDAINWTFNPAAAMLAGQIGERSLIYHCVDEYSAFSGVRPEAIQAFEGQLLDRADLVIVSAETLLRTKRARNGRTVLVRHGVDFDHFRRALAPDTPVPDSIANLPRPVIGFFGLIADWVDADLLASVARRFPAGSLVLVGKVASDVSALDGLPNVHRPGRVPYDDLPGYCKGFDVVLMPFRVNELTLAANPLKVREYLAAGLPVVSTAIPEVEALGCCRIGRDVPSFLREVEAALVDPGPSPARSEPMRGESWEARVREIRRHMAAALPTSAPFGATRCPEPSA